MKPLRLFSALLATTLLAIGSSAADTNGLLGKWKISYGLDGDQHAELTVREEEGELRGTWKMRRQAAKVQSIRVRGNRVSFHLLLNAGETRYKVAFDGTVVKDKLFGSLKSAGWNSAVEGQRQDEEAPPPTP